MKNLLIIILLFFIQESIQSTQLAWKSYVYWQREHGIRKTIEGEGPKVWMFGGSAVWGSYVEWNETIPSLLAKKGFKVTNYGETGYVSTQELILLILELREDTPEIVIFYNGFNDVFSSFQQGVAGIPMNEFNRRKEFNLTKRETVDFRKAQLHEEPWHDPAGLDLEEVFKIRDENLKMAEAIGWRYGFVVYSFLQPNQKFEYKPSLEVPDSLFIDEVHINKIGNEIVANHIYEAIK